MLTFADMKRTSDGMLFGVAEGRAGFRSFADLASESLEGSNKERVAMGDSSSRCLIPYTLRVHVPRTFFSLVGRC